MYYKAKNNFNDGTYKYIDIRNITNFTLNYKFLVDRVGQYVDTLWLKFSDYGVLALRIYNGIMNIWGWDGNIGDLHYNTNISIKTNTIYNITVTCNNNIYKWYLDGNFLYSYNNSNNIYNIMMIHGWLDGNAGDFNFNYTVGDIFFSDECLIDGNFTVDNTKLFMNELGPGTTLESNDKIYGMK